ncbi:XAC0095 family protein [Luteimonas terrae]|uniref:XAC0095-like domain-containing protein n=1 Tax=Luteimonas terrae TaxID=1530191 RepID=A0ABU1XTC5_9GAMM|nr:hypothetical protein [Luteimonas terrae]MDR7192014.1 hypothetical protein [Luteimonas terrae]
MSKSDTKTRGALGYLLPEDSHFRLRKLHQHIVFLSRLAEPRVDEEEDGPEIDHPALAGCLELLAEQVQQVLDTVSWPARLEAKGKPAAAERDAEDADDGDEEMECEDAESAGSDTEGHKDFDFGMTLDQVDEADRLLDLLRAQGDLLMASGGNDVADGTITVMGAAIFDGAEEMKDLIRQIEDQVLDAKSGGGSRVREMPAAYGNIGGGMSARLAAHRPDPDVSAEGYGVRLH